MSRRILCLVALALLAQVGCKKDQSAKAPNSKPIIAVIPKSTDHPYWNAVKAGAVKAGNEGNAEIRWQGPNSEADRQTQIRIVGDMVEQGADAICIAPNDQIALADIISQTSKKVPVIVFDSGVNTEDYTAYVATDNRHGGELAGQEMLRLIGEAGGKIAVVRGIAGSESTTLREDGFIDAVKKNRKVVLTELRGDNAELKSKQVTADLLSRDSDIVGFFGPSEPVCKGILGALQDGNKAGKIHFVGFDGGDELAKGLDSKAIDALVVQRPVQMGELAVKAALAALRHETVQKKQPIDPLLITQQNKDEPDVRQLLQPKTN